MRQWHQKGHDVSATRSSGLVLKLGEVFEVKHRVSMYGKYGSDMRPVWKSLEVPDSQMLRNIGITVHPGQCAAPSQVTLTICVHVSLDVVYLHTKFEKQMLKNVLHIKVVSSQFASVWARVAEACTQL